MTKSFLIKLKEILRRKKFLLVIYYLKTISYQNLKLKLIKVTPILKKLWAGHQRRKLEHKKKGNGFGYSSFNAKSKYTSTISARYYKDGSEILIEQQGIKGREDRPRKLHPIEAARLQGYPIDDWFKIPVSDNQAYKQFGNSVSVPVVTTLASEIKSNYYEFKKLNELAKESQKKFFDYKKEEVTLTPELNKNTLLISIQKPMKKFHLENIQLL